ncbi:guanosine-diphosphatase [Trichomonascus vanleenenianus]|uniref:guanosine-diphosphatase n=1 Tax=Trichomonascus vanleenenianus TaxID=2268995 RepID=UPI003ECA6FEE
MAGIVRLLCFVVIVVAALWAVITRNEEDTKDVRYVLVIDAGSAGSRVHIYEFSHESDNPELVSETFDYVIPGLSSYAESPQEAARSLDPLIETAIKAVPEQYHSSTPIAVQATAGLRLLKDSQGSRIMEAVYSRLRKSSPFVVDGDMVGILDGKHEGVYAWTTVNYLLGNLNQNIASTGGRTAAVFDLGGASTQIVFEPNLAVYPESVARRALGQADHMYQFRFGNQTHVLYQHSHLGYGLMEARKNIHRIITEEAISRDKLTSEMHVHQGQVLLNPCVSVGLNRTVEVDISDALDIEHLIRLSMMGPDRAQPSECIEYAKKSLNLDKECHDGFCGFNGVYQPSLSETFSNEDIYIVSYFYDRISPLNMAQSFPLVELQLLTEKVCKGADYWQEFDDDTVFELVDRPEWCLDLAYMFSMLHYGYGIPLYRHVTIAKQVDGYGLSWALGLALQMLQQPVQTVEYD